MSHGKIAKLKLTICWKTDLKWTLKTLSSKQASTSNREEKKE